MHLAIKGHATRGKEVIEILKMLGGKNSWTEIYSADDSNEYYAILGSNLIHKVNKCIEEKYHPNTCIFFTLEEFLEKYPYKVEDNVLLKGTVRTIIGATWDSVNNEVIYKIESDTTNAEYFVFVYDLQPYKEQETMEETKKDLDWHPTDYLEFVDNDDTWADEVELNLGDSYEIVMKDGKIFAVKKNSLNYVKDYPACKKLVNSSMDIIPMNNAHKGNLMMKFQMLLICRDAYWKIAGDWKPDWTNAAQTKFCITVSENKVVFNYTTLKNRILIFPTEEMRDAFYENFKELINECKELL